MKLLLTSGGIRNKTLEAKLLELMGKSFEESKVVFIPTASHMEIGDKSWFIKDLAKLKELNFKEIDIADIAVAPRDIWLQKLESADVIFCEGGSNFFLARVFKQSNLKEVLEKLLEEKVWVGASAGGMIMSPYQSTVISQEIYEEDFQETENIDSLGFVNFQIIPHFNSGDFVKIKEDNIRRVLKGFKEKVFVLDDNSAIAVVDGKVEVVSEGDWFEIN